MKIPKFRIMADLPLGIAATVTIFAVGYYLITFHLVETIIVYAISFFVAFLILLWYGWCYYLENKRKK